MDLEWRLVVPLIGLLVLVLLLTGPGLWSDKWGWWWMKDDRKSRRR